jgi:hypothetical protein
MTSGRQVHDEAESNRGGVHGLALALAFVIPVWVAIGLVLMWAFQTTPITRGESAVLMIAAALEVILLRNILRTSSAAQRAYRWISRHGVAAVLVRPWHPAVKRSLALSAVSAAYLQYYFADVYLQIASMRSVTVFVPVSLTG